MKGMQKASDARKGEKGVMSGKESLITNSTVTSRNNEQKVYNTGRAWASCVAGGCVELRARRQC